jgi:hypothetical protein
VVLNNEQQSQERFGGAGVMFVLSQPHALSKAPQRLSASAPLSTFRSFIIFNSVLMLFVAGCGRRDIHGLPRSGSLSAAERIERHSSWPLVPSEAHLTLGKVTPGSQISRTFWLTNRSMAPVEVVETASSCDCLRMGLPERCLAPGQKVEGRIELDLRKEPHFVGKLGIVVEGRGRDGETLFVMTVHVTVGKD